MVVYILQPFLVYNEKAISLSFFYGEIKFYPSAFC
jgi:hypothetical protein